MRIRDVRDELREKTEAGDEHGPTDSDAIVQRLRALLSAIPELVLVCLRRNFGETLALQAGLDRARGDVIVTMDGDLQNDPRDIPRLLDEIMRGVVFVSGWRRARPDDLLLRKLPSWVVYGLIGELICSSRRATSATTELPPSSRPRSRRFRRTPARIPDLADRTWEFPS